MNDEYSRYAKKYNQRLRNGDLRSALGALREMAELSDAVRDATQTK